MTTYDRPVLTRADGTPIRVLAVDDESSLTELLSMAMRYEGWQVATAASGNEAVKVAREMILDRQYVVRNGEIVIVDEFTGRLGEGRKWRAGIHQAVEAKEGVEITFATNQAARITVQDFFLRYNRLAGMTGTAASSAGEPDSSAKESPLPP